MSDGRVTSVRSAFLEQPGAPQPLLFPGPAPCVPCTLPARPVLQLSSDAPRHALNKLDARIASAGGEAVWKRMKSDCPESAPAFHRIVHPLHSHPCPVASNASTPPFQHLGPSLRLAASPQHQHCEISRWATPTRPDLASPIASALRLPRLRAASGIGREERPGPLTAPLRCAFKPALEWSVRFWAGITLCLPFPSFLNSTAFRMPSQRQNLIPDAASQSTRSLVPHRSVSFSARFHFS